MQCLYSVRRIREIEAAVFARRNSFSLMQQAGEAVADVARTMTAHNLPIVAVAGCGNNGGDAFVAARRLRQDGYRVRVLLAGERGALSGDAKRAYAAWCECGGDSEDAFDINAAMFQGAGCIIDALFGIGLSRPLTGAMQRLVEQINVANVPVVSVDSPSGLCADTGLVRGVAVRATQTLTFFGDKPGLHTNAGREYAGEVSVCTLGETILAGEGELLTALPQPEKLRRSANSHKGDYGSCLLVGGASGMLGALVLAARAAATLGAGKVRALPLTTVPSVDWLRPDIMWGLCEDNILSFDDGDVIAIGMGLGTDNNARTMLARVLESDTLAVLDADALTIIGEEEKWQAQLCDRQAETIITPHPAEAGRLLGVAAAEVNADRVVAAKRLSDTLRVTTVLKGSGTVVCSPDGRWAICAAGNPGLARGGSGDVLAGMISALLAQTQDTEFAARAGVFLHAQAADKLAAQDGVIGVDVNRLAQTAARLVGEV